jgi:predicted ribosomally synthesized peptide with SipW-like signal peptide
MPLAPSSNPTAHGRADARRPRPGSATVRVTLLATLVLLAALTGIGGTYAYWSAEQSVDGAELRTGTAELKAAWAGESSAMPLLPGETTERTVELRNTGDVPLEITATTADRTGGFTLRMTAGPCEAVADTDSLGVTPVPVKTDGPDGSPLVLKQGEAASLCLTVGAADDLLPGQELSYVLMLEGKQVQ